MISLARRLSRAWNKAPEPIRAPLPELSIDIGCGPFKREGYVGLDMLELPGVDHTLDFEHDRLPFDDGSVGRVFSSHCLEHLRDMTPVLREISRVSAHGAQVELWAPYSWHGDAHLNDHVSFFNERQFIHIGVHFFEHWRGELGARWRLRELVYQVYPFVLEDLRKNRVEVSFALRYFKDVCHELGVVAEIDKSGASEPSSWPRISYATSRLEQDRVPIDSPRERFWGRVSRRCASALMSRRAN